MKTRFKLGDKVRFSHIAYREMTYIGTGDDPKPWYHVAWKSWTPKRRTKSGLIICVGPQKGIYVGTRVKQNGLLVSGKGGTGAQFKRLGSVTCGLVATCARTRHVLVLIEDLEKA